MQLDPLLEQIDWFFTSPSWTLTYPNTMVNPLARPTSDHVPCVISVGTSIPKAKIFRFEDHWIRMPGFMEVVDNIWAIHCHGDSAKIISAKFKLLRQGLKKWSTSISTLNRLVDNCNEIILMLDNFEELRPLHISEWNFRKIVKNRLQHLLNCKKDYWKKRCTTRWAKLGNENTAFFHSMATIRYRKNTIASLTRADGSVSFEHQEKAGILWQAYRDRLGCSAPIDTAFDFSNYVQPSASLDDISAPFTEDEIDKIVMSLPAHKAPGPDGFSGLFIKTCWHIVRFDFYRLCREFWEGTVNLQSINDAYITLIPKMNSPEGPNDYRPISLLNISLKILTKLLANRLQSRILNLVHVNQYGFLKSRSIQDCVAWAYEYIHQCKQARKEVVILKLDFAKAFDTIEHQAIINILKCWGFDDRWIGWVQTIFGTAFSSVLLNGVPGKKFPCRRGVRQGDPFSPILFVAGADLLQSMVNQLARSDGLTPPLPIPNTDFPIVQYADDTLLILQACPMQLTALKDLLRVFSAATGLKVNYSKSCLMPVNIDEQRLQHLANTFGCATGSLPFTYLGLPLGTTRPTVQDLSPIVDQMERRLNASARFLDYGGRLQLVNSVLSTLPNHYLTSLKIHKTIINIADRSRRHCLWAKDAESSSVNSLAAWSMVCRPKRYGGLGVTNFELQNKALLLKQLHKFYSQMDVPWVKLVWSLYDTASPPHAQTKRGSFWWRDVFSLVDIYRSISSCDIRDGKSVLFWKDFWHSEGMLCSNFPRLFSYALNEDISVGEIVSSSDIYSLFALPLSVQADAELVQLQELNQQVTLLPQGPDVRIFQWGNANYTASKLYNFMFGAFPIDPAIQEIWKSKCLPKLRVFSWLLLMDRLNTKELMQRKHWQIDSGTHCMLCNSHQEESRDHLFFSCSFAKSCWDMISIRWENNLNISARFSTAKRQFRGPCFMEIVACAAWNVWKERNDFIFRNQRPSLARWRVRFQSDISLHQFRVKETLVQPLLDWIRFSFI